MIVPKRKRRLEGIDQIVLTVRGLTTGEIAAHVVEVYGAKESYQGHDHPGSRRRSPGNSPHELLVYWR